MNHQEAQELFRPWVDAELGPTEEAQLSSHLEGCVDCRLDWEAYSGTVATLRELPTPLPPRDLASKILRRARRRRPSLKALQLTWAYRVPAELLVPLLVAASLLWWFLAMR